jgi:hypothetical protein
MGMLASVLLLIPGMMGVGIQTGETANFELLAVDHPTGGMNHELCFAVPIIPSATHVFM